MRTAHVIPLSVLLLNLASCLAPEETYINHSSLKVSGPSTVYWGDSVKLVLVPTTTHVGSRARYAWSFGDTGHVITSDTVVHWYVAPGDYTLEVRTIDTAGHPTVLVDTRIMHVAPRACKLSQLQRMLHVTVSENGRSVSNYAGFSAPNCSANILWNDLGFSASTSYSYSHSDTGNYGYKSSSSSSSSVSGVLDSMLTCLRTFGTGESSESYSARNDGGSWGSQSYSASFGGYSIPFIRASDSEIVFRASAGMIHANANMHSVQKGRFGYSMDVTAQKAWTDSNSVVTIRFYR